LAPGMAAFPNTSRLNVFFWETATFRFRPQAVIGEASAPLC